MSTEELTEKQKLIHEAVAGFRSMITIKWCEYCHDRAAELVLLYGIDLFCLCHACFKEIAKYERNKPSGP